MLSILLPLTLRLALPVADPPSAAALARAAQYVERTGGQAFVVMHRGRIVQESYAAGGAPDKRQLLASGSKSFVGVATIAAVQDGLLRLDAPMATYLPEWRSDDRKSRITVRQLLSLESGLESGNPGTGCGGRGATWADAVAAGTFADPGTTFRYGPVPFIAVGAAIERVQSASFERYLETRILAPLGVQVEWRTRCGDGKPQLAGGATMTARDWATFGEMIRNGGTHNGRRILEAGLVRELFRPSGSNANYGMSWWLAGATMLRHPVGAGADAGDPSGDSAGPTARRGRLRERIAARRNGTAGGGRGGRVNGSPTTAPPLPAWLPADLVMAAGAGDQRLFVIPSRELVIVRMGPLFSRGGYTDAALLEALLAP